MATINSNTRSKKLFEEGLAGVEAIQRASGIVAISKEKFDDLEGITDISQVYNDEALYQTNRFLLKQVEDLRQDVEDLNAFVRDFFGTDSNAEASVLFLKEGSFTVTGHQGTASKKAVLKNLTITIRKGLITGISESK